MTTMLGNTVATPWGRTSVWMRPTPPNPVYSVNPWALLEQTDAAPPPKPKWSFDNSPMEYNPPPYGMMGRVPIMVTSDLMKFVIGREGSVFKAITYQVRDAKYIWYHKDQGVIEIWATNSKAMKDMEQRLVEKMLQIQEQYMKQTIVGEWSSVTE